MEKERICNEGRRRLCEREDEIGDYERIVRNCKRERERDKEEEKGKGRKWEKRRYRNNV